MKRKYNPRKFRIHHSYTAEEAAELLDAHIATLRNWRKQGLKAIDPNSKPYLFTGRDLIAFIKAKNASLKRPLQQDESFCFGCQKGTKSRRENITIERTGKKIGKDGEQTITFGICEICGTKMRRFGVIKRQDPALLLDSLGSSLNANIINAQKYD